MLPVCTSHRHSSATSAHTCSDTFCTLLLLHSTSDGPTSAQCSWYLLVPLPCDHHMNTQFLLITLSEYDVQCTWIKGRYYCMYILTCHTVTVALYNSSNMHTQFHIQPCWHMILHTHTQAHTHTPNVLSILQCVEWRAHFLLLHCTPANPTTDYCTCTCMPTYVCPTNLLALWCPYIIMQLPIYGQCKWYDCVVFLLV